MAIIMGGDADSAVSKPNGAAAADIITDTTTKTFIADVIEASREVPVLVDFWAPWCGPCKQLQPVLEKTVKAARGAVKLVKLNIDEHPAIPGQMGIKSVPAVLAFRDGQPVDGFMGAVPESQVVAFIERLTEGALPGTTEIDAMLDQAQAMLAAKDYSSAAQAFGAILQEDRTHLRAIAGLALCYLHAGDTERAEQTLALAPPDAANDAVISAASAQITLKKQTADLGDAAELVRTIEGDPQNHQARFDLALALNAAGRKEEAVDHLVAIIRHDRGWNEEAARKQLLQFFDAWGPTDAMTIDGRRKLSSVLFS